MLEIRRIDKTFGSGKAASVAISHFDLTVETGEVVSLIGPTGCGKTTALRIIAGLLPPSHGDVMLDGRLSLTPSPEKAMVFQMFNLFPWRTALGNVAYGLEMQGVPKARRLARAHEFLGLVGMEHRAGHYPHQMSGGQNQRVGLARALAIEPKLMLMDEPFGSLDAITREHLQGMVQRICTERGLTVMVVTHSVDEAIFLSDRIIVMGVPGRVIGEFPVDLPRPRDEHDWHNTSEYTHIRREVWRLLEGQLHQSESTVAA